MAFFRRHPNQPGAWVVVDLPAEADAGSSVMVSKRDGSITPVTIASILTLADGTRAGTLERKRRKTKAVTCPECGHGFEA